MRDFLSLIFAWEISTSVSSLSFGIPKIRNVEERSDTVFFFQRTCSLHDLEHIVREVAPVRVCRLCDVVWGMSLLCRHEFECSLLSDQLAEFGLYFNRFCHFSSHFNRDRLSRQFLDQF